MTTISERPVGQMPLTEITDNDPRRHSNPLSLSLSHSHSHSPIPDKSSNNSNSSSPQLPTMIVASSNPTSPNNTTPSPRPDIESKPFYFSHSQSRFHSHSQSQSEAAGAQSTLAAPAQSITLNINDYASDHGTGATNISSTPTTTKTRLSSIGAHVPPSPTNEVINATTPTTPSLPMMPIKPDKPPSLAGRPLSGGSLEVEAGHDAAAKEIDTKLITSNATKTENDGLSSLYVAHRAALRPSPLSAATFGLATLSSDNDQASISSSSNNLSKPLLSPDSTGDTPRSSLDSLSKPPTRAKPSWLKRASLAPGTRSKSRSPANSDTDVSTLPASASLPPALPPRHSSGSGGIMTTTAGSIVDRASAMLPPELPAKPPGLISRSGGFKSNGQGRGPDGIPPPQHPSRDGVGNLKGRIAAWSQSSSSSSSISRSQSSNSLASHSQSFTPSHQRLPSSAQRAIGSASSAVSKGWAGLRSRGIGGSISSMSGLVQLRGSPREGGLESSSSWSSSLARKSDKRQTSDDLVEIEGPLFVEGVVKRKGRDGTGCVFGRDLTDAGRAWGVYNAAVVEKGESEYSQRRKQSLPAIVIRCVDYLELWGPKEEGIFRISGRSSHLARIRREFDSGADLDLTLCDPGDLDPHAVAGAFKSYLRELPTSLLTVTLESQFEKFSRLRGSTGVGDPPKELSDLVQQLPSAHWFLLADIVKLIDLIPRHVEVNRMSHNALMLSLGPTLRLTGDLLDLFLHYRKSLFSTPPAPSLVQFTTDLINFGDVDIAPPSMPTPELDLNDAFNSDAASISSRVTSGTKKTPPRVPKKPSLSRLLSASGTFMAQFPSTTNLTKKASSDTLSSIVDPNPPRVELPSPIKTEMGSFGLESTEHLMSTSLASSAPPVPAKFSDKMEEMHYPTGTVEERARAFFSPQSMSTPTPIADRFRGTSTATIPLRAPKSSTGSTLTTSSMSDVSLSSPNAAFAAALATDGIGIPASANPTTLASTVPSTPTIPIGLIRSGPPIFFQSAVAIDRHNRSLSSGGMIGPAPIGMSPNPSSGTGSSTSVVVGGMTPNSSTTGTKRKDDAEIKDSDDDRSVNGTPAKRLSAGPGLASKMAEEAEGALSTAGIISPSSQHSDHRRSLKKEGVKSPEIETVATGVEAAAVGKREKNDGAMNTV